MVLDCCMCGEPFEPDRVNVDAWGMSGEPFDPTDWECAGCADAWMQDPDDIDDVEDFPPDPDRAELFAVIGDIFRCMTL